MLHARQCQGTTAGGGAQQLAPVSNFECVFWQRHPFVTCWMQVSFDVCPASSAAFPSKAGVSKTGKTFLFFSRKVYRPLAINSSPLAVDYGSLTDLFWWFNAGEPIFFSCFSEGKCCWEEGLQENNQIVAQAGRAQTRTAHWRRAGGRGTLHAACYTVHTAFAPFTLLCVVCTILHTAFCVLSAVPIAHHTLCTLHSTHHPRQVGLQGGPVRNTRPLSPRLLRQHSCHKSQPCAHCALASASALPSSLSCGRWSARRADSPPTDIRGKSKIGQDARPSSSVTKSAPAGNSELTAAIV